jgi:hypothetical protein
MFSDCCGGWMPLSAREEVMAEAFRERERDKRLDEREAFESEVTIEEPS